LLDEKGPDHSKCFEVGVSLEAQTFGTAWGNTKKQAEQKAAYRALVKVGAATDGLRDDDVF
jgi:ribonuclease-3